MVYYGYINFCSVSRTQSCHLHCADIAHSWLKTCDNVLLTSGQPTWSTLVTALQHIGHPDVASSIIIKSTLFVEFINKALIG